MTKWICGDEVTLVLDVTSEQLQELARLSEFPVHELRADAPAYIESVAGLPYCLVRICHYYCFNCRALERQAAIAAGQPLGSDAGLHGAHVVIGRN